MELINFLSNRNSVDHVYDGEFLISEGIFRYLPRAKKIRLFKLEKEI